MGQFVLLEEDPDVLWRESQQMDHCPNEEGSSFLCVVCMCVLYSLYLKKKYPFFLFKRLLL